MIPGMQRTRWELNLLYYTYIKRIKKDLRIFRGKTTGRKGIRQGKNLIYLLFDPKKVVKLRKFPDPNTANNDKWNGNPFNKNAESRILPER